jgi:hypothetical protein
MYTICCKYPICVTLCVVMVGVGVVMMVRAKKSI